MHFTLLLIVTLPILTVCQDVDRTNPVIKKCHCPAYQSSDLGICKNNTNLMVQLLPDPNSETVNTVNLTELSYVIEPLTCEEGFHQLLSYEPPFISYDGRLHSYLLPNPTDQYCIENSITDGNVVQSYEACLEVPRIQLCCGKSRTVNVSTGVCNEMSPTYNVTELWPVDFKYEEHPLKCEGNPQFQQYEFSTNENVIAMNNHFKDNGIDYCLAAQETEIYSYNMSIMFCAMDQRRGRVKENETNIPSCCMNFQGVSDFPGTGDCIPDQQVFEFPEHLQLEFGSSFNTIDNIMTCQEKAFLEFNADNKFVLDRHGSLTSPNLISIAFDRYCLGMVKSGNEIKTGAIICFLDREESPCLWRFTVIQVCLIISTLFFVATLMVYVGIEDLRNKLNGICVINELVAILISQITLLILQMNNNLSSVGCVAAGIIEIISILASFFWLNVMCYDVWSTLSVFRPVCGVSLNKKLIMKYSLYAWGIPLLIGMVALTLQLTDSPASPNFSTGSSCFFPPEAIGLQWGYLYGIILAILLANIGFFIHLAIVLVPMQRETTRMFKSKNSTKNKPGCDPTKENNEILKLYLKLFLVMGLPWLIEVFTSFAQGNSVCYLWVLNTVNALRGIFIFIIFVTKKTTMDMIRKRWTRESIKRSDTANSTLNQSRSRKTSLISLSSFIPSRKTSKVSLAGYTVKEDAIREEDEDKVEMPKKEDKDVTAKTTAKVEFH